MSLTVLIEKHCFYVEIFHAKRQIFELPDICVLILLVIDPLLSHLKRVNHRVLIGNVHIELHTEVVDVIESESNQAIHLLWIVLSRSRKIVDLIEAEDMLHSQILKHLTDINTVRNSDTNDIHQ